MIKRKYLLKLARQAASASFVNNKLSDSKVNAFLKSFKALPEGQAIPVTKEYLKAIKTEIKKQTLMIESTEELTASQVQLVKDQMQKKHAFSNIEVAINSELLGGLRIQIGDTVYDDSVRSKIAQVKDAIHG